MPYIITLKEPIKIEIGCSERVFEIEADSIGIDDEGILAYVANGYLNYMPVSNLLGTYFVKKETKEVEYK